MQFAGDAGGRFVDVGPHHQAVVQDDGSVSRAAYLQTLIWNGSYMNTRQEFNA